MSTSLVHGNRRQRGTRLAVGMTYVVRIAVIGLFLSVNSFGRCAMADSEDAGFCVIRPDEPASIEIFADHNGRRFYFCCPSCRQDFLSDPARFDGELAGVPLDPFASDGELQRGSERVDPFARTFWGRVGRVVLVGQAAGKWIRRSFYLHDRMSFLLALSAASFASVVAILWMRQCYRKDRIRPGAAFVVSVAAFLLPCFYADRLRHRLREASAALVASEVERMRWKRENREMVDRDMIHYATLLNFGDPPIPRRSQLPRSLRKTYYRGNDERSEELPHGGNYRTVSFDLWIEDAEGGIVQPGCHLLDNEGNAADLFLVTRFNRSPDTSSGYFTDEYMQRMYVTMQSGDFLGRDEPIGDRVSWTMIEADRVWTARYPLPRGVLEWQHDESELHPKLVRIFDDSRPGDRGGIVYLCEDRYDRDRMIGGRFHYAIQYDLITDQGMVTTESDLWMEATYRGRNFAELQIQSDEWLSSEPIPEK